MPRHENYYITRLGDTIKLTYVRAVPDKGTALPERDSDNDKLDCNVLRARRVFQGIGLCNSWEYLATFTSALENPDSDIRRIPRWISDWNRHHKSRIKYLMIYEVGGRGRRLHAHALLKNVPEIFARKYTSSEYRGLPPDCKRLYSLYKSESGGTNLCWCPWWRAGWSTLVPLDGNPRAISYLLKYMTKGNISFTTRFGGHSFFASKGLNRPVQKKIPSDIVSELYQRVPTQAWRHEYRYQGEPICSTVVLDKDKVSDTLWQYYIAMYENMQELMP